MTTSSLRDDALLAIKVLTDAVRNERRARPLSPSRLDELVAEACGGLNIPLARFRAQLEFDASLRGLWTAIVDGEERASES